MKNSLLALGIALLPLSAQAAHHAWSEDNDPRNLDKAYKMNLDQLPPSGGTDITHRGWSGSYWPETRGYIADRWQDPSAAFKFKEYKLPTASQIQTMSAAQINLLSPAEKIDIIRGRFALPLMKELQKDKPTDDDWWKGLCNGWTMASLNIDEPHPIVYSVPGSQIKVPLGTGDIKGLLAFYYANRANGDAAYVGSTCQPKKIGFVTVGGTDGCADNDVNAGAFHVVIANELGIKHQGIAMDRDPTFQVWNQPFLKYTSTYKNLTTHITGKSAPGTKSQVTVTTDMLYANEMYKDIEDETDENDVHTYDTYQPVLGTSQQNFKTVTYQYVLDLDARGNIIGGDWISETHPDLIWKQDFEMPTVGSDDKDKTDDWSVLTTILKMATQP